MRQKQNNLIQAGIFFLSLFLFTVGIYNQEITSFDSRFYLFAEEMWRNGLSWFPTTYNQPYPDYPVTSTVLIYLLAKLFGGLNKLIAVLPSAIAAAWTMVLTYRIGNLHNRNWGLIAVCFALMTLMFFKCARSISLDMYVVMNTAWCFYLISSPETFFVSGKIKIAETFLPPSSSEGRHEPGKVRSASTGMYVPEEDEGGRKSFTIISRTQKKCLGYIYFLLALSFAFRGPIGLVIPAGVICSYYALDRDWRRLIWFGIGALSVLIACTALLLFLAYHVGGDTFMQDVIRMQVAGRIDNSYLPFYFYFTNSLGNYALSYPLAILVMISIFLVGRKRRMPQIDKALLLKLAGWALIILIGMSIPGDKKSRYILPMVPAIALIAAYPFAKKIKNFYNVLLIGVIAISLDVAYIAVVEPAMLNYDSTSEFVTAIERLRGDEHAKLVFYRENQDGTPIKYQVYNTQHDVPVFLTTEGELLNYKQPAFFITSEDYFAALPKPVLAYFNIIARGRVGHVMMIVFKRN